MSVWENDASTLVGLKSSIHPLCLFHRDSKPTVMELFDTKLLHFKLHPTYEDEPWSFAIDVDLMCPYCGWRDLYGVAIDEEHFWQQVVLNEKLMIKDLIRQFKFRNPLLILRGIYIWLRRKKTIRKRLL